MSKQPNNSYLNKEVADSSQAISNAGLGLSQPVVVRNADIVHILKKSIFARENQLIQSL